MEKSKAINRNLVVLLVSFIFINLAIGFYRSFSTIKNIGNTSISFTVQDKSMLDYMNNESKVDFIGKANEMIDIFEKYNFSVESFLNDQSSNLIIFSSWPNDFLNIKSVNKRKKLFLSLIHI